jgi:predicted 3-demethylubiquinone-9 3-methyltransferase (glyoxalase superfamily)
MQRISPFLWFDTQAEEASQFYVSIFPNSQITQVTRYPEQGPGTPGTVMTVSFVLDGQEFMALNGGPETSFSQAVSFMVACETQEELDRYWERLGEGGQYLECGWLTDKYGLPWQIVPADLPRLMDQADPERAQRVMTAVWQMVKLDIATLQRAYEGNQ